LDSEAIREMLITENQGAFHRPFSQTIGWQNMNNRAASSGSVRPTMDSYQEMVLNEEECADSAD
jgi:hypothetical protein